MLDSTLKEVDRWLTLGLGCITFSLQRYSGHSSDDANSVSKPASIRNARNASFASSNGNGISVNMMVNDGAQNVEPKPQSLLFHKTMPTGQGV